MLKYLAWKIRWFKWWFSYRTPMELYLGPGRMDKESRMMVWDRRDAEWQAREPKRES